jgi:TonB family protein
MPTCFYKRFLPFALTLMIGLLMGKFLGSSNLPPARTSTPQQTGFGIGSGAGYRDGRWSDDSGPFNPKEVDEKARVLLRIEPQYTEEARANRTEGTVVLRAIFSSMGRVENIRVVSGLPFGLTERAVDAARQIRFSPAMKDGRPVSQYIQIEYNFQLY